MEVAPVGIQMTYANANNAGQVQHNMNQAAALQQSFENVREQQDAELKQSQVRTKDDSDEGGTIKDDPDRRERGGGHYYRQSKKRNQPEEEPEQLARDPKRGRFLDISL